jgi:dihydrofolate synthase/folylpolyglutamate synthase
LSRQGKDFGGERIGNGWNWFGLGGRLQGLPLPALAGEHQLLNAAAAIQLLRSAGRHRPVSAAAIRQGLETVKLAGRFQYFDGPVPVLVDVAHNPQAAGILAGYLRGRFPGKRVHAVFAVMRDKDIAGVVKPLIEQVERWYLAPIPLPRAASAAEIQAVLNGLSAANVDSGFARAADAFAAAKGNARQNDMVVVFGTFPLVAEFLALNP